ncbi:MAG TPA: hypothetical protein VHN12_05840, partial [Geobacteraceae bacterium]|nr:hypothetical protein [Geobacteraceae bacterium]
PAVPHHFNHTSVGSSPSQNRACAIYAHGSSHGQFTEFPNILTLILGSRESVWVKSPNIKFDIWRLDPFMFSLFPFLFQRFLLHLDLFNELQVQGTYKSPSCFPL